ncbi:hypothetical protein AAFF_G00028030, partial [Aldrovandia affinis]
MCTVQGSLARCSCDHFTSPSILLFEPNPLVCRRAAWEGALLAASLTDEGALCTRSHSFTEE